MRHAIWRVIDHARRCAARCGVESLYIADGNHRVAALPARAPLFAILRRRTLSWRLRFHPTRSAFFRTTGLFAISMG